MCSILIVVLVYRKSVDCCVDGRRGVSTLRVGVLEECLLPGSVCRMCVNFCWQAYIGCCASLE